MDLINAFDGYLIIQINTQGFWADSRLPQEALLKIGLEARAVTGISLGGGGSISF